MSILFTADTHFGHKNIIRYCNRPFSSVGHMDEELISRWNTVVRPDDTVYHLGDFAFTVEWRHVMGIRKRLNGQIHLITGNHEKAALECQNRVPSTFASIASYAQIEVESQPIVLFHYGLRTWWHDLRGTWMLYGHSHGGLPPYGKSIDVGVDCWNFKPVTFEELADRMSPFNAEKDVKEIRPHVCLRGTQ